MSDLHFLRQALAALDPQAASRSSYQDFHVKGFDYLCLKRTPHETIKVYFFDGDVAKAPEVVIPHNHRYDFDTYIVAGKSANRTYRECDETWPDSEPFEAFDYLTPLNDGDGFSWSREARLRLLDEGVYERGETYWAPASEIHTIQILGPETVLCLRQYEDVVPIGQPTVAFKPAGERDAPNLSGLYTLMSPARIRERAALVTRLLDA